MDRVRDIGARIFEEREQRGWSQTKLAQEAGVSQTTVVHVETGQVEPRLATLRRLAKGFGMSVEELTGEAAPKESASPSPAEAGAFEGRRTLQDRRLISAIHPFVDRVEADTNHWRELVDSGRVNVDRLDEATRCRELTARSLGILVDAAIAEGWSDAEMGMLRRVYEGVKVPHQRAWNALFKALVESFGETELAQFRRRSDEAGRKVEKATAALREVS